MNILAIDYGEKRIGLAWCQIGLNVVLPFGIIDNNESAQEKLQTLITEEGINELVFGLPIGTDNQENDNTQKVRDFAEKLNANTNLPIHFIDERYSSKQADKMEDPVAAENRRGYQTHGGLRQVKTAKRSSRDERSAMVILQSYLDTL